MYPRRLFLTVMAVLLFLVFILQLVVYSKESFRTRRTRTKTGRISFFVLGDFGGVGRKPWTTRTQRQVATQMMKTAQVYNVSTIIGLGDNFYPHGVRNVNDPRFQSTFEEVYSAEPLEKARWLMVAGNHDYEGNVTALLEYSNVSPRWHFPYYYYSKVYRISGSYDTSIQIVMIDTKILCSDTHRNNRHQSHLPSKTQHRQWLKRTLTNSKSDYLIVAGHNPVFSGGHHGGSPCLLSYLKPLLEQYDVTAYFSGHDHNFQHVQVNKMSYFVSGNGNFYDAGDKERRKQLGHSLKIFHGATGGFTILTADHTSLQVIHVNTKGQYIYNTTLLPRPAIVD